MGLLATGKSDFEAADGRRQDGYIRVALGLERVPSSARLRQRMDEKAMDYARAADEANILFLERLKVPVSPVWTGHVPLDMDLFPQNNSGTKKERVSYTYKGHDGYGVMAAYLGAEGWCLSMELKPGSEGGQRGFGFVLDRVLLSSVNYELQFSDNYPRFRWVLRKACGAKSTPFTRWATNTRKAL